MPLYQAIILGIVQGLTEFLPVSSTAHLVLVPRLMGWTDPGLAFDMALHIGTLLAVAAYFRDDLLRVARAGLRALRGPDLSGDPDQKLCAMLVIGTIPAGVLGVLLKSRIETTFRGTLVIAAALVVVALVILLAEWTGKRSRGLGAARLSDAAVVGLGQAVALIPGVSRSGATIAAGLFAGLSRETAARLSFLVGFPTILGAAAFSVKDLFQEGAPVALDATTVIAGAAASAVSGYLCIAALLAFLARRSLAIFIAYRVILGVVLGYLALARGL